MLKHPYLEIRQSREGSYIILLHDAYIHSLVIEEHLSYQEACEYANNWRETLFRNPITLGREINEN